MNNNIQSDVMASNANPTQAASNQPTTVNEAAIDPRLKRWIAFCEQTANAIRPIEDNKYAAQFLQDAEDNRKAKAEKRLNAKLRKLEIEQKAILLAEHRSQLEAHKQSLDGHAPSPDSTLHPLIRDEMTRLELLAMEREQKEALLNEVMEKRAKELGEQWPPTEEEMRERLRFDHIPKYLPGEKAIMERAFPKNSINKAKGTQ
jgi:hypothetical protein